LVCKEGGAEIFQPIKNQNPNYHQVRNPKPNYKNQFKFDEELCTNLELKLGFFSKIGGNVELVEIRLIKVL
jgi:hypothetical protein